MDVPLDETPGEEGEINEETGTTEGTGATGDSENPEGQEGNEVSEGEPAEDDGGISGSVGAIQVVEPEVVDSRALRTDSSISVYRLYNPYNGEHHYTKDANEYKTLPRYGWRQEGVAWYSSDARDPYNGLVTRTPIVRSAAADASTLAGYFRAMGYSYPSGTYSKYGAASIEDFCKIAYEEATAEGVDPAILFAQVLVETIFLILVAVSPPPSATSVAWVSLGATRQD